MRNQNTTLRARNRLFGRALTCTLAVGLAVPALGQDGVRREGVPVTNPETDKELERPAPVPNPTETSADLLPPVPASINDPAPFGTRAVGVDPGAPAAPLSGAPGRAARPVQGQPGRAQLANIKRTEGVVTKVMPPKEQGDSGKVLAGELIRLQFDPNQSWLQYSTNGPDLNPGPKETLGKASKGTRNVLDEATREPGTQPGERGGPTQPVLTLVLTRNTHVFVHARTREGQDLYGVTTISSPDSRPNGVGVNGTRPRRPVSEQQTNFTNIKEGSFLSVRYRMVGNLAEAINVNLIEYPVVTPGESETVPGTVRPAIPGAKIGPNDAAAGQGTELGGPAPAAPAPARVPVVPGRTVSPGTLPR